MSCGGCPDIIVTGGAVATTFADPSVQVGLAAVNGVALTAMRSDAAPPIDQAISPTWSGDHDFQKPIILDSGPTVQSGAGDPEGVVVADIGSSFWRTDGTTGATLYVKEADSGLATGWRALPPGSGFANPTAKVQLAAVNGIALTAMRSDASPPIDQDIAPTWTHKHTFEGINAEVVLGNITLLSAKDSGGTEQAVIQAAGDELRFGQGFFTDGPSHWFLSGLWMAHRQKAPANWAALSMDLFKVLTDPGVSARGRGGVMRWSFQVENGTDKAFCAGETYFSGVNKAGVQTLNVVTTIKTTAVTTADTITPSFTLTAIAGYYVLAGVFDSTLPYVMGLSSTWFEYTLEMLGANDAGGIPTVVFL